MKRKKCRRGRTAKCRASFSSRMHLAWATEPENSFKNSATFAPFAASRFFLVLNFISMILTKLFARPQNWRHECWGQRTCMSSRAVKSRWSASCSKDRTTWGRYIGTRVSRVVRTYAVYANSFIKLKFASSHSRGLTTGSDIIQTRLHENDINSDDMNRISVDTDSSDGLTSR